MTRRYNKLASFMGLSLGACARSILEGEVRAEQVIVIITSTRNLNLENREHFDALWQGYSRVDGRWANHWVGLTEDDRERLWVILRSLWRAGKIHQPLSYGGHNPFPTSQFQNGPWVEVPEPNQHQRWFRHKKGGIYEVLNLGLEVTGDRPVTTTIYRNQEHNTLFLQKKERFDEEGRFVALE